MTASDGALSQAASPDRPPAIQALDEWTQVTALVSGRRMMDGWASSLGGARTAATTVASESRRAAPADGIGVRQCVVRDLAGQDAGRAGVGLRRLRSRASHPSSRRPVAVFGGYTDRNIESARPSSGRLTADRLADGPIGLLVDRGGHEKRFIAGGRSAKQLTRHALTFGGDVERTSFAAAPTFTGAIEERVDGVPARIWHFSSPGLASHRRALAVNAFAADHFSISSNITRRCLAPLRSADASTHGAAQGIHWRSLLPAAYL